jgi:ABC-type antimicrobial peptide transport system permease subunit
MKQHSLSFQSFRYYWKSHVGLLFGAFLASAILSGSLVVGDSVRASLRKAAEQRLGKVQTGLVGGDRWFTEELAKKSEAAPIILMSGSVSEATGKARVNAVQVLGVDASFWKLSPSGKTMTDSSARPEESLAVNASLAHRLGVKVGDTLLVRLEKPSAISKDAPLSGSTDDQISIRRKISAIVAPEDFGAFQLAASQTGADSVFLPLSVLQAELGKKGRINVMLWANGASTLSCDTCLIAPSAQMIEQNQSPTRLSLEDFALKLERIESGRGLLPLSTTDKGQDAPSTLPSTEWQLTTDRVFMDDSIAQKVFKQIPGSQGVLTYLVNGFSSAKGRTPYSFVAAAPELVQASPALQEEPKNQNSKPQITVSQWLADDLGLALGDSMDVRYFTVGLGREMTEKTAGFTVAKILPMETPGLNGSWTPDFPGVTDAPNCRDWKPGIPVKTDAIRDKDEAYWKKYHTTPKAFISLKAGQKLWSNRFGNLTAIRFSSSTKTEAELRAEIVGHLQLSDIGLVARDFKSEARAAAQGSVDFGGLFVGLSMFLIAAALVFAALLFLFTLEQRAAQIGLLLALGWTPKAVRRAVLSEAGIVAVIGAALGILGGILYTKLALAGLNGVWSGATVGLKLIYQANPETLGIAFIASIITSLGTLWWASRQLFKSSPKDLLAGEVWASKPNSADESRSSWFKAMFQKLAPAWPWICLLLASVFSFAGSKATNPEEIGGMFFGAGFMLLTAGLLLIYRWLIAQSRTQKQAVSLSQIGARNVTRRPSRSLAVIGMMSGGIFLVIAVNAFRIGAEADPTAKVSGTGGFALIGESTLPIYEDLNSEAGQDVFALDEKIMKQVRVVPFRVREGDDASCLNLNKAQRPMLTAVNPAKLADRFAFVEGGWEKLSDRKNAGGEDSTIPAIADQATAMWGLGKGVGDTIAYTDSQGHEFKVKLVGLLAGSVLQGKVVISEEAFLSKYPDAAGYKFFLIDSPLDKMAAVSAQLTKQLETRGLALESTVDRLAAFSAVQNTYIGIFTILGGLGVLLGTAGLGVLAARNVLERRGEFGLMQALGFRSSALRGMVLSEHVTLLIAGLVLGLLSAAIAVWPNVKQSGGALPLGFLGALTLGILAFGIIICWLSAALALRGKLLDSLRKE